MNYEAEAYFLDMETNYDDDDAPVVIIDDGSCSNGYYGSVFDAEYECEGDYFVW